VATANVCLPSIGLEDLIDIDQGFREVGLSTGPVCLDEISKLAGYTVLLDV
jgi:hypothetical protein